MTHPHEWDESSNWPSRLLHVETLTSYPWEPDDKYGGQAKPRYNAISYTWGRFALKSDENPEVKAAPIKGTTWERYLPRMNPSRYTVEDLICAIKTAACPDDEYSAVDFVWLDIACIDQTPNSPEMAREIGRQARIFRGAIDTFVWLTTHTCHGIIKWAQEMDTLLTEHTSLDREEPNAEAADSWLSKASELFQRFIKDDWFSSTWTLQEGFLSPKAIFIFKDGLTRELIDFGRSGDGRISHFRLETWVGTWHMFMSSCRSRHWVKRPKSKELYDSIVAFGLSDCVRNQFLAAAIDDLDYPTGHMGNPLGLLVASRHRKASYQTDRVYGIMQVFDFRLGKSAPGAAREEFTLEDLELQLSAAVLDRYTVLSQLVVQSEECIPPKSWMISSTVLLPEEAYRAWNHLSCGGLLDTEVRLSGVTASNLPCASFGGLMTPILMLLEAIGSPSENCSRIVLDSRVKKEIGMAQSLVQWRHLQTTTTLARHYGEIHVLLLGRLKIPEGSKAQFNVNDFYHWGLGLILGSPENVNGASYYTRLGFMTWDIESIMDRLTPNRGIPVIEYLEGKGSGWAEKEGQLG